MRNFPIHNIMNGRSAVIGANVNVWVLGSIYRIVCVYEGTCVYMSMYVYDMS